MRVKVGEVDQIGARGKLLVVDDVETRKAFGSCSSCGDLSAF